MTYKVQPPPSPTPNVQVWDPPYIQFANIHRITNSNNQRKHIASGAVGAAGLQPGLTFRCNVKAVVSAVAVVLGSVSSATLILTLLFNGSVTAVLTLSNSANENVRQFTLAAVRTMDTMTDRFEIHAAADKGDVTVLYDYRIL